MFLPDSVQSKVTFDLHSRQAGSPQWHSKYEKDCIWIKTQKQQSAADIYKLKSTRLLTGNFLSFTQDWENLSMFLAILLVIKWSHWDFWDTLDTNWWNTHSSLVNFHKLHFVIGLFGGKKVTQKEEILFKFYKFDETKGRLWASEGCVEVWWNHTGYQMTFNLGETKIQVIKVPGKVPRTGTIVLVSLFCRKEE